MKIAIGNKPNRWFPNIVALQLNSRPEQSVPPYACAGADPENFSRGGPTLTYNCGSAQISKITNFFHFQ